MTIRRTPRRPRTHGVQAAYPRPPRVQVRRPSLFHPLATHKTTRRRSGARAGSGVSPPPPPGGAHAGPPGMRPGGGPGGGAEPRGVPQVLRRVYGARAAALGAGLRELGLRDPGLARPGDPAAFPAYARLLSETYLVLPAPGAAPPPPPPPSGAGPSAGAGLEEHKRLVLRALTDWGWNATVEAAAALLRAPWRELLRRIGPAWMRYLLGRCSVFLALPNGSCLQVCGPPLVDAVRQRQFEGLELDGGPRGRAAGGFQDGGEAVAELESFLTQEEEAEEEAGEGGEATSKRKRPPSWERRELKRLAAEIVGPSTSGRASPLGKKRRGKPGKGPSAGPDTDWVRPSERHIPREYIMYGSKFPVRIGPPRNHVVLLAADVPDGPKRLVCSVFRPKAAFAGLDPAFVLLGTDGWRKRFAGLVPLFGALIKRARTCSYSQLLRCYCPLQAGGGSGGGGEAPATASSHRQVALFLWAATRHVVPPGLLGCEGTRKALARAIEVLVGMRLRERVSLQHVLAGVSTRGFPWGAAAAVREDPSRQAAAHRMTQHWVFWLLSGWVIPLLRANFYASEVQPFGQRVFYFQKAAWDGICDTAMEGMADPAASVFEALSEEGAYRLLSSRSLGYGQLRLVPKKGTVRPLANLSKAMQFTPRPTAGAGRGKALRFQAINSALLPAHSVVKFECQRRSGLLGASVFSYGEVHERLQPVLRRWKAALRAGGGARPFVFTCDVEKAFDNISLEKLWPLVCGAIADEEYTLHRYAQVTTESKGNLPVKLQYKNVCSEAGGSLEAVAAAGKTAVCVNHRAPQVVRKSAVLRTLKAFLFSHVVNLKGSWYLQKKGIPQGSSLSPLLCSLFLGDLEAKHGLAPAAAPHEGAAEPEAALLRWIDDFLYITPCPEDAAAFAGKMLAGFPEYGVKINPRKTGMNFDVEWGGKTLRRNQVSAGGGSYVAWCGLLLDSATLDVHNDFRKLQDSGIRDTMNIPVDRRPMKKLGERLRFYLWAKSSPLLFDGTINSGETVRLNFYQLFFYTALKGACFVHHVGLGDSAGTVAEAVDAAISWLVAESRKMKGCSTPPSQIQWLGLRAFIRVFSQGRAEGRAVLQLLDEELRRPDLANLGHKLQSVTHPARSPILEDLLRRSGKEWAGGARPR